MTTVVTSTAGVVQAIPPPVIVQRNDNPRVRKISAIRGLGITIINCGFFIPLIGCAVSAV